MARKICRKEAMVSHCSVNTPTVFSAAGRLAAGQPTGFLQAGLQAVSRRRVLTAPVGAALVLLGAASCRVPGAQTALPAPNRVNAALDVNRNANVVDYEVTPDLQAARLHVALTFDAPVQNGKAEMVSLQMPVWSPGDYHVQNFGKRLRNLRVSEALAGGNSRLLSVTHPDFTTWTVEMQGTGRIRVEYDLPEMPPGYFSQNVQISSHSVFVNGASALLYLDGHKDMPARLTCRLPDGWRAETPLPRADPMASGHIPPNNVRGEQAGTVSFNAPDYDTLADSPLVMADGEGMRSYDLAPEQPAGTRYRAIYWSNPQRVPDIAAYNRLMLRLAQTETRIMGGAPNPLYDFFIDMNGRGCALEHLNACCLSLDSQETPLQNAPFLAHEFFHQWNVKRIRPHVLGPFDYTHPPRTRNLWFAEGVTEYYAHVMTRRAGLYTEEQFATHWRKAIADMQRNPARLKVTADQASWNVWDTNDSRSSGGLSYYDKGELIGLCLDLTIRHVTGNRKSLDDVMRALLTQCAPPRPGYAEDDLRATINAVTEQDLSAFYTLLARSTQELPFAECLSYAGLDTGLRPLPNPTPAQAILRSQWTEESH